MAEFTQPPWEEKDNNMLEFTKLASFLDSFQKDDPNYDAACYIKKKLAEDLQDRETINNGEEDDLQDNDITMATPDQQAGENTEGELMSPAFQELDALNQIKEEKEEIEMPEQDFSGKHKSPNMDTFESFGDGPHNQKEASLFSILQKRIKK